MYEHLSLWTQVHFLHKTLHYFEIFEALLSVYVTFPHPLVLYLCSGDLIGFGLLIFLQLLRILHLLPLCLIEVALQKHKYCYIIREENSLNLDTCRRYNYQVENTTASENSLVLVFFFFFLSNVANGKNHQDVTSLCKWPKGSETKLHHHASANSNV